MDRLRKLEAQAKQIRGKMLQLEGEQDALQLELERLEREIAETRADLKAQRLL